MFCPKCGAQIPGGAAFCASCGSPVGQLAPQPQPAPQPAPQPVQPVQPATPGSSKTTLIIAIIAIVVIVVVVIAAVLLMGGGGVTGPTNSIMCDIRLSGNYQGTQVSFSATTKIKKPDKMNMDMSGSMMGIPVEVKVRLDGNVMYMYNTAAGAQWIRTDAEDLGQTAILDESWAEIGDKTPEQLATEMRSSMGSNMGITPDVSCRYVTEIPDSEFTLPPGAMAIDAS